MQIDASEAKFLMVLEFVNSRVKELEIENTNLKQELEDLKRDQKKIGIVIIGVEFETLLELRKNLTVLSKSSWELRSIYRMFLSYITQPRI